MATTYNIKVLNKSNVVQNYFLFSKPPAVSGVLGQVYSNAWVTFPNTPNYGTASLSYTDELYAYWGTVPRTVAPGVVVNTGQGLPVTLGPNGTDYYFSATPTQFDLSKTKNDAPAGQYTITSGSDFSNPSPYVFGLGKIDAYGLVSPVATFAAQPSSIFNIAPVTKVWVSTGGYTEGTVIDVTQIGASIEIDFTGKAERTAVVTQSATGQYSVQYFLSQAQLALYLDYSDQSQFSVARHISSSAIKDLSITTTTITETYILTWKSDEAATAGYSKFQQNLSASYPSVTILEESGSGVSRKIKVKGKSPVDTKKDLFTAIADSAAGAVVSQY